MKTLEFGLWGIRKVKTEKVPPAFDKHDVSLTRVISVGSRGRSQATVTRGDEDVGTLKREGFQECCCCKGEM